MSAGRAAAAAVPSAEENALLDRRAAELAAVAPVRGPELAVLTFAVAGRRVGVELDRILRVVLRPRLAAIPAGPPALAGLLGVRGRPVAVVDLRRLLVLPGEAAVAAVVVLDGPPAPLGVTSEDIPRVENLSVAAFLGAPAEADGASGILAGSAGDVTLLAVAALLADPRCSA